MAYRAGFPGALLSVTSSSEHRSGIVETVGHGLIELQGAEMAINRPRTVGHVGDAQSWTCLLRDASDQPCMSLAVHTANREHRRISGVCFSTSLRCNPHTCSEETVVSSGKFYMSAARSLIRNLSYKINWRISPSHRMAAP